MNKYDRLLFYYLKKFRGLIGIPYQRNVVFISGNTFSSYVTSYFRRNKREVS